MRRDDDVVELEQRARVRLGREDVERRARDLAAPQRLEQRVLVDELAAGGVDEPHAVAHPCERVRVDRPARLVRQRQVEREELRGAVDLLRRLDALDPELAEPLRAHVRVVRDDAHAEAERAARDLLPDAPEAEHAERLPGELDAAVRLPLPASLLERRVRLRDVPCKRDEEPDRVLRGGDDRRLRRVGDDDPAPRRRLDVDVVDADAGTSDDLEVHRAVDQRRR